MTYSLQSYLAPIPEVIYENFNSQFSEHCFKGKKVVFAPHCELVFNAFYRGMFYGFDVLGALDRDQRKIGQVGNGLRVYHYDDVQSISPDFVVVLNTKYHVDIMESLASVCGENDITLIDLCEGYNHEIYRAQLSRELDCREIKRLRPGCIGIPETITSNMKMKVEVVLDTGWGLGDKICAMSAAREFARRNRNLYVHFNDLVGISRLYQDELIKVGAGAFPLPENFMLFHRERESSPAGNYLGAYYLGLGINFTDLPKIELPDVSSFPSLEPNSYIALQPTSNWAKPNLDIDNLVKIIQGSPLPVILTGWYAPINSRDNELIKESKRINCKLVEAGADGRFISDELSMLRIIRHAKCVVTPRSASAHIASAYNIESVVLVPDDELNWHLDYPGWRHHRLRICDENVAENVLKKINTLIS